MAIGVVVAAQRAADLVTVGEHGDPLGEGQGGEEVSHHPVTPRLDALVLRGSLLPPVAAPVGIGTVPASLSVRLVVLSLVAHQVPEGEAVVAGREVDAREGAAVTLVVDVGATGETRCQVSQLSAVATPEATDRVSVLGVPLSPSVGEVSHLVSPGTEIPRLGDQLHLCEHRVLLHHREEAAQAVHGLELACQGRSQVEAEPVDVHLLHPVAEAVHDQLERARVAHVEAVPATGEVDVVARVLRVQAVVGAVVDAAERERRSHVTALGGVVVDHVEEHLDAGAMQCLHHRLELVDLLPALTRREARVRGQKPQRVVPPVVGEPPLYETSLRNRMVYREEFDCRDGQRLEMIDHRIRGQTQIGAAQLLRHVGVSRSQSLHVTFVDHGPRPACAR